MYLGLFVCLFASVHNSKTIAPIDLICLHKENKSMYMARSFAIMIQIGIRVWTHEFIKGFFTIARHDQKKVHYDEQKCIITSKVHHSE